MDNQDKQSFKELMADTANYYDKPELSQFILRMYFEGLERFSFEQIKHAANCHIQKSEFMPKVSDFVKHLEGGQLTANEVIAAAKMKNTPFGILCRIHIGTANLATADSFQLRQIAEECLQLLPEWKVRAQTGNYSDHELSIMIKHEVNPAQPFAIGMAPPQNSAALISRVEAIQHTPRHKELLTAPYREPGQEREKSSREGLKRIAGELKKIENIIQSG